MWSARGAYRDEDGQIMPLMDGSPLWTSKEVLLAEVKRDHPGLTLMPYELYRWVDEAGEERFVIIEEHRR